MQYFGRYTIPHISKNSSVLMAIVFTELFAIIVSLLVSDGNLLAVFSMTSIYLNWVVLLAVMLLSLLRKKLNRQSPLITVLGAIFCCYLSFCLVEVCSQYIINKFSFAEFDQARFFTYSCIALICSGIVLRLFSILTLMEQRNKSEMSMKMQALQSRIKPHFLFNSLNTVSELIVTAPEQAELAIDSLAMLFRANLENDEKFHALKKEILLCERYISLERWSLGDKLSVNWDVEIDKAERIQVPKLIIQPIIENSMVHGRQADGRVEIFINIRESKTHLSIMINNTKGGATVGLNSGNGIALENIRQRLFVLYDDQFTFKVRNTDTDYETLMSFSKQAVNQV